MFRALLFLLMPMALVTVGVLAPLWDVRRSPSEKERAVTIRLAIFTWMLGLMLALALVLLPNKQRALMLVPIFVTAVVVGRVWRRARRRAQREREEAVDLEHMKRVN